MCERRNIRLLRLGLPSLVLVHPSIAALSWSTHRPSCPRCGAAVLSLGRVQNGGAAGFSTPYVDTTAAHLAAAQFAAMVSQPASQRARQQAQHRAGEWLRTPRRASLESFIA